MKFRLRNLNVKALKLQNVLLVSFIQTAVRKKSDTDTIFFKVFSRQVV